MPPVLEGPRADAATRTRAGTETETDLNERVGLESPWRTVVWNDPVNLMSYVVYVFRSYFAFSRTKAQRLMLQVHNDGKAIVAVGGREEMERHVAAMHDYGLWATLEKAPQ